MPAITTKQQVEEIEGEVLSIRFRAEGENRFTVAKLLIGSQEFAIVGADSRLAIQSGIEVRLRGVWVHDPKWGDQFKFSQVSTISPTTRSSVIAYLDKYGQGIGKAIAGRLFDKFGTDAVKVLRTEPSRAAAAVSMLSKDHAVETSEILKELEEFEETLIGLVHLFEGRGFAKKLPEELVEKYGIGVLDTVERNPFFLMLERLTSCGFLRCDQLYLDLGKNPGAIKRQLLSMIHRINSDMSGNTWIRFEWLASRLREDIVGAKVDPSRVVNLGLRTGRLSMWVDEDGIQWITTGERAEDERRLTQAIRDLLSSDGPSFWPDLSGSELSEHQKEVYKIAAGRRVSILAGTPGTGKTYAAVQIIKALIIQGSLGKIAVSAPTGKAGVRLKTVLEEYGIRGVEPRTVHSLLKPLISRDGWSFTFGRDQKLPQEFFFIDEVSMLDLRLARCLFEALPENAHVFLIGDPYQLPPVGNGAPLRDLIASGRIGYGELDEVRRNSGDIVRVCRELKDGKRYDPSSDSDEPNLQHYETGTSLDSAKTLLAILKNLPERYDPIWDTQIICALNTSGDLNREKLNEGLRGILNPDGHVPPDVKDYPLRFGDKVICLANKNHELLGDDGEDLELDEEVLSEFLSPGKKTERTIPKTYVANGEIGKVVRVEKTFAEVMIQVPKRRVRVQRFTDNADPSFNDWSLAYAVTCHKMQGSSSPIVITLIDDSGGAKFICRREWFYTAISRAEDKAITIGSKAVLDVNSRETALGKRKTFLKQRLEQ